MMALETAEVDLINMDDRVVHMTDGTMLPIVEFYDDDGAECDPDDAIGCSAGTEEYGFVDITIVATEPVYLH
jgi:hypothetical protein